MAYIWSLPSVPTGIYFAILLKNKGVQRLIALAACQLTMALQAAQKHAHHSTPKHGFT